MARNTIKISQVINDFMITLDHDDYANDVTHASVRVIALRGVREMGFDMLKKIRSKQHRGPPRRLCGLGEDWER